MRHRSACGQYTVAEVCLQDAREAVYRSLTTFINPIVAVILGAVVLGESIAPQTFVGAALVLGGLLAAIGKQMLAKVRASRRGQ